MRVVTSSLTHKSLFLQIVDNFAAKLYTIEFHQGLDSLNF